MPEPECLLGSTVVEWVLRRKQWDDEPVALGAAQPTLMRDFAMGVGPFGG